MAWVDLDPAAEPTKKLLFCETAPSHGKAKREPKRLSYQSQIVRQPTAKKSSLTTNDITKLAHDRKESNKKNKRMQQATEQLPK